MGQGPPIHFGTGGWRGILHQEVTPERVRAAARAAAAWLAERGGSAPVLVGYDTRQASASLARVAADAVARCGLSVELSAGPVATPVVSSAIPRRGAAGALVLTASHNPPDYHGMKVFGEWGGAPPPEALRRIEAAAAHALAAGEAGPEAAADAARSEGAVRMAPADWAQHYRRCLAAELDAAALARSRLRVVYDAMHGAGGGVLDGVLAELGVGVRVLRGERDPRFGGVAPDPRPERLDALVAAVRDAEGPALGLASDGDGDRFAAVSPAGRVLSEAEALALIVDHLARTGRARSGIAISVATGSLVERVARGHGLEVERLPIGFSHLSRALARGAADAAGDESGGFAWSPFGRDKDGMLAGALLAERVALGAGSLDDELRGLAARFGVFACGRRALPADAARRAALADRVRVPPERVDDARVRAVATDDGLHLRFDDGFLMLRASQTEPVVRIYAEAAGRSGLGRRLDAGEALLTRG
jgi:phosphomannomutase